MIATAPLSEPPPATSPAPAVVIVTGMSGAGRTTAIKTFEDMGFEALNNFPLGLIETLLEPGGGGGGPLPDPSVWTAGRRA